LYYLLTGSSLLSKAYMDSMIQLLLTWQGS
jgi:hypothetical protein